MPNLLCTVTKITVNWVPPPRKGGGPASTQGVPCYVFIFGLFLPGVLLRGLKYFFQLTFMGLMLNLLWTKDNSDCNGWVVPGMQWGRLGSCTWNWSSHLDTQWLLMDLGAEGGAWIVCSHLVWSNSGLPHLLTINGLRCGRVVGERTGCHNCPS